MDILTKLLYNKYIVNDWILLRWSELIITAYKNATLKEFSIKDFLTENSTTIFSISIAKAQIILKTNFTVKLK